MKRPLLAWPGTQSLKLSLPLSFLFLKIFVAVYGTASLLAAARPERPRLYFDFELAFPFVPSLAVVYLTVGLALVATPFVLRTWREIVPFFFTLTAETLAGGLCFLLLPVEQGYPPRDAAGFWGGLFRVADTLNLEYNEVPSLHVTFAVTAALVFGRRCGWLGRSLFALWALGVSVSTLFLHEHHLVDVAAGAALAVAAVATVHRRTSVAAFLEAVRIEALCLREAALFARRHRRYLATALAVYVFSLRRWRETRRLRAAWCLAQHVDDVLDGDRAIPGDPEAYARRVIRVLEGDGPDETVPAEVLAAFVRGSREQLIPLFEVLIEDRRRMDARRTMSAADLAEHHRKTFFYSLDLTLVLAGAKIRAGDAPELIAALSWCSPVRDLREDLAKGLINVPAEVMAEADGEDLLASPAVLAWLEEERQRGTAAIRALGEKLPRIEDARGRTILAAFHRALARWRPHPLSPSPIAPPSPGRGGQGVRFRQAARWLTHPYAVLDEARRRHGLTFWLDLPLAGRALVTGDPEMIREIVAHPDLDAGKGIEALREVMGDRSLITLDGEDHAERRRIVGPLFRRDLERLDGITVQAALEFLGEIPLGTTFAVYDLARRISLRAIVRLLFGETSPEEAARAEGLVDAFLLSFDSPWVLFLKPLHLDLGPLNAWGRALRNRRRLEAFLRERIAACRRSPGDGSGLARIVREGSSLSDGEIVAEVLALLLFGHDTGAAALAWAFAHIHQHPQTAERIREESDVVHARHGRCVPEEHPYLRACLEESMRLAPVVVHLTRVARRTTRIGAETVPAGARVFPSAYLAQHNPEVFPEPERFRPERFLEGRSYEGAWFPFGFGARTCVGRHYATRQMILLASTLARHADLALSQGYVPRPVRRLVLIHPEGGTPMVLRGRRDAA